jgi:hypothetical protein
MLTNHQPLQQSIEFSGSAQYPLAMQTLLENATSSGAVIVRNCFELRETNQQWTDIRVHDLVPDRKAFEAGYYVLSKWWKTNGYANSSVIKPFNTVGQRMSKGFSTKPQSAETPTAVNSYAAVSGSQELYSEAGVSWIDNDSGVASPAIAAAYAAAVEKDQRQIRKVPVDSTYRHLFSDRTTLRAGDIALVMGQPVPARHAMRARRPRPGFIPFSYFIRHGSLLYLT